MATTMSGQITIVSGLPRSGTSMMMRMLEAGGIPPLVDTIRGADDDNPNGYYEYEKVLKLERDSSWIPEALGKSVKIVYRLLYHIPNTYNYKVIFMQRELSEVITSQEVMLRRKGRGPSGLTEGRLAELFTKELSQFFEWVVAQPNFQLLIIHYRHVIQDPATAAVEICRFLGQDLDRQAMARVCEPALYRQRR
jgi:sulfotransferase family protein